MNSGEVSHDLAAAETSINPTNNLAQGNQVRCIALVPCLCGILITLYRILVKCSTVKIFLSNTDNACIPSSQDFLLSNTDNEYIPSRAWMLDCINDALETTKHNQMFSNKTGIYLQA